MNALRTRRARGFTLLEVLIALAIVALASAVLLGTITSSASNISYLRDKTLAEWVAMNRLTEIRIAQLMPDPGNRTGNTVMAGQRWEWEEEVSELPIKGMFRIDVRVRPTGETVDDSKPATAPTQQVVQPTETASAADEKLAWTTTVTGVISTAISDRKTARGAALVGGAGQGSSSGQGAPNNQGAPGAPGAPTIPGSPTSPNNPGLPGNPRVPPKPAPSPSTM